MGEMERELRSHFDYVDTDGNGVIDLDEFERLLKDLGISRGRDVVEHAFRDIDTDGNGRIDFSEFGQWWSRKHGSGAQESERDTRSP